MYLCYFCFKLTIRLENIDVIGTTDYVEKEKEKATDILYLHCHF